MSIQTQIDTKLATLDPLMVEVVNESHMHSVPANSETHFKVTLVSDRFSGLSRVKRHQQLYALLSEELDGPVHALALHLYTAQEWAVRGGEIPNSPNCLGGGKH
ncbi:BolA family protein [Cobetia amphilecti]|uniref:BolA family protein n=1 Tax=Cobetia amphilecti TaxID=1055104 RepID=UPI00254C3B1C|nr:BolA/IbaG family iron-sulfur metabolism protein [Cobetia amphilecti]